MSFPENREASRNPGKLGHFSFPSHFSAGAQKSLQAVESKGNFQFPRATPFFEGSGKLDVIGSKGVDGSFPVSHALERGILGN
jgi:hypothetical protein